jgi:hypothetical protein
MAELDEASGEQTNPQHHEFLAIPHRTGAIQFQESANDTKNQYVSKWKEATESTPEEH